MGERLRHHNISQNSTYYVLVLPVDSESFDSARGNFGLIAESFKDLRRHRSYLSSCAKI